MNKPVLVPDRPITSLGSAIFACVTAGLHPSIAAAQAVLCPSYRVVHPDPAAAAVYQRLYQLYRTLYFALGDPASAAVPVGEVLPALREIAAAARTSS